MIRSLTAISVFAVTLCAQQRVPPGLMYHRVWVVSPLIGTGKAGDPKRPLFVPAAGQPATNDHSGILGYQMQLSDDGKSALVEFVFANAAAFQSVLQTEATARSLVVSASALQLAPPGLSTSPSALAPPSALQTTLETAVPGLKIFERGKAADADIITEFQKHKAGFKFAGATVRPQ